MNPTNPRQQPADAGQTISTPATSSAEPLSTLECAHDRKRGTCHTWKHFHLAAREGWFLLVALLLLLAMILTTHRGRHTIVDAAWTLVEFAVRASLTTVNLLNNVQMAACIIWPRPYLCPASKPLPIILPMQVATTIHPGNPEQWNQTHIRVANAVASTVLHLPELEAHVALRDEINITISRIETSVGFMSRTRDLDALSINTNLTVSRPQNDAQPRKTPSRIDNLLTFIATQLIDSKDWLRSQPSTPCVALGLVHWPQCFAETAIRKLVLRHPVMLWLYRLQQVPDSSAASAPSAEISNAYDLYHQLSKITSLLYHLQDVTLVASQNNAKFLQLSHEALQAAQATEVFGNSLQSHISGRSLPLAMQTWTAKDDTASMPSAFDLSMMLFLRSVSQGLNVSTDRDTEDFMAGMEAWGSVIL